MAKKGLFEREGKVEGHLIDSLILTKIYDRIIEWGGDVETLEVRLGKHKSDTSFVRMLVKGSSVEVLGDILEEIHALGAVSIEAAEAVLVSAPADMVFPDNFYSTTNSPTRVFFGGEWLDVEGTMMDKVIVVDPVGRRAFCRPIREVRKGDLIVVGESGVLVRPPERRRGSAGLLLRLSGMAMWMCGCLGTLWLFMMWKPMF